MGLQPCSEARPWDPGGRCGSGGRGGPPAGRQETESSWALPYCPLSPREAVWRGSHLVSGRSPTSLPHLGAPGSSIPEPPWTLWRDLLGCPGETNMPGMGLSFQNLDGPHTCFSFLLEHALSTSGILDLLGSARKWGQQSSERAAKAWLCGAGSRAEGMGSHREAEMWRPPGGAAWRRQGRCCPPRGTGRQWRQSTPSPMLRGLANTGVLLAGCGTAASRIFSEQPTELLPLPQQEMEFSGQRAWRQRGPVEGPPGLRRWSPLSWFLSPHLPSGKYSLAVTSKDSGFPPPLCHFLAV